MTSTYFILATLLSGCATSEDLKELSERVDKLEASMGSGSNSSTEKEASQALREISSLMSKGKIKEAKAKLKSGDAKYAKTRMWSQRGSRLKAELDVFGKAAPESLGDVDWLISPSQELNLASGTTFIVFWELWCPHCKREVPKLQKTYDSLSIKHK